MDAAQQSEYITQLLSKDSLNEQEIEWLVEHEAELKFELEQQFILHVQLNRAPSQATLERNEQIRQYLLRMHKQSPAAAVRKMPFLKRRWVQYAASIILLLGIGIYYYETLLHQLPAKNSIVKSDKLPGGNKAVLILANGRTLILDSLNQGILATEGGSEISKSASGEISYHNRGLAGASVPLNTLKTPMGGQYQLQLPDGTKVWLNAASSIEYPVAFTGKDRRVKVSGELYFEVAQQPDQPFIVESKETSVEVLGTAFNFNCYDNEDNIQTTLVSGKVKVMPSKEKPGTNAIGKILQPGQQAVQTRTIAGHESMITVLPNANIDKVVAWKAGLFNFEGASLRQVMRQLERWYDIKVVYAAQVDNVTFKGKLHRNINLSNVLEVLDIMEIKYELKGDILYVK